MYVLFIVRWSVNRRRSWLNQHWNFICAIVKNRMCNFSLFIASFTVDSSNMLHISIKNLSCSTLAVQSAYTHVSLALTCAIYLRTALNRCAECDTNEVLHRCWFYIATIFDSDKHHVCTTHPFSLHILNDTAVQFVFVKTYRCFIC